MLNQIARIAVSLHAISIPPPVARGLLNGMATVAQRVRGRPTATRRRENKNLSKRYKERTNDVQTKKGQKGFSLMAIMIVVHYRIIAAIAPNLPPRARLRTKRSHRRDEHIAAPGQIPSRSAESQLRGHARRPRHRAGLRHSLAGRPKYATITMAGEDGAFTQRRNGSASTGVRGLFTDEWGDPLQRERRGHASDKPSSSEPHAASRG